MPGKTTDEQKQQIVDLYLAGEGCTSLAKKFGVHENSILKQLKRAGVEIRNAVRKILPEDHAKIVEMYQQEMSAPKIAEHFNCSHVLILRYLEQNGIARRCAEEAHRKYKINEDFFDVIDTQEKAYFLGFLYADGCNLIETNTVRIDLATPDRDILEKLVKLIYLEDPLYHIKNTVRENRGLNKDKTIYSSYMNINSKHICKVLYNLGCENRKSLTLKWPQWLVDKELQRHFIRGYYDGDGGVSLSQEKRNASTLQIISTLDMYNNFFKVVKEQTNIQFGQPYHPLNIEESKDVYRFGIAGNRQIENFLKWLYKDATIYLDRKYNVYLKLLKRNEETQELILAGNQGYSLRYLVNKT